MPRPYIGLVSSSFRISFALALAALLALTAQGAAFARGLPGAAGRMELCTGTGPVMIDVDENGSPTAPPHLCPDFALQLLLTTLTEPPDGIRNASYFRIGSFEFQCFAGDFNLPAPMARDPPLSV